MRLIDRCNPHYVQIIAVLLCIPIAGIGVAGFVFVSSGYTESLIAGTLAEPFDTSVFGANEEAATRHDLFYSSHGGDSRYMIRLYARGHNGQFYLSLIGMFKESIVLSVAPEMWFGDGFVWQPFFFFVLLAHCLVILLLRFLPRLRPLWRRSTIPYPIHLVVSLAWLVLLVWGSRLAVMVWSNPRWGPGAYLRDGNIGFADDLLLYALFFGAAGYVLYASGRFVRRTSQERVCAACGYPWESDDSRCAECGALIGNAVTESRGVRLWVFGVLLGSIFFSPVLVSSVFHIFA